MTNTAVFVGAVLACTLAADAGAQKATGRGNPAGTPQGRVTVTGCLQPAATAGSVGTAGSSSPATAASTGFILTNARVGGTGAATAAPGSTARSTTSGTSADTGNGGSSGSSYVLRGQSEALAPHAGKLVEVSGRVSATATGTAAPPDAASGRTTTGSATGATGNTSGGNSGADAERGGDRVSPSRNDRPGFIGGGVQAIDVTTVRLVSETCAQP